MIEVVKWFLTILLYV